MQQGEFDDYYSRVVLMFLDQRNARYNRIHQMMTVQADMETGYTVGEMLAMDGMESRPSSTRLGRHTNTNRPWVLIRGLALTVDSC